VTVVVRQPGAAEARTLRVTRTVVPIDTVLGYRRKPDGDWVYRIDPAAPVGYLRITTTNASTLHELRQAEKWLRAEGVRALVLDLRSSQRHELHHIELVADGLLDGGLMWRLRGTGGRVQEFRADRDCLFRGWPLAVIVESRDGETPPGELAAALQDNGRAVVVGATLQCEGHVKSLVHLPDGQGSIALLTGRLERADGRTWPVRPDHPVALEPAQRPAVLGWLHAKELSELPPGASDRPPDDPQLRKAVEVLREALKNAE
jgi:carboxyl-terminal processing protease